ncbi:MAG: glycoside hydrolase family 3 N-terminal domain-containing protein [Balneolales bacterium]
MKHSILYLFLTGLIIAAFASCAARREANPAGKDRGADWVSRSLERLTLEEKVAQMMSPRVNSYYLSEDTDAYQRMVHYVEDLKVGGLTFFQGHIYDLATYTNDMQARSDLPLLISSDFERGVSMRISRATIFPVNMALGASREASLAYRVGSAIASEGRALGVHQNFAPVLDVNNNAGNPVINVRSFGENPALVAEMGEAYMHGLHDGGMISTGKHFPGHGDTDSDSHLNLPVIPYGMDRLNEVELVPFRHAIARGLMSVMSAHIAVPELTGQNDTPATLSPRFMTGLLREEMGFSGIIVTDAMDMHGIASNYSAGEAAVLAVKAGVDVVLLPPDPQSAIEAVVAAVHAGDISEQRIDLSVSRLLAAKQWSGLDESRFIDMHKIRSVIASREHQDLAREVARKSITLVKNENGILPLNRRDRKRALIVTVTDREDQMLMTTRDEFGLPNQPSGTYFAELFRRNHSAVDVVKLDPRSNQAEIDELLDKAARADIIVGASYILSRSGAGSIGIPDENIRALRAIAAMDKPFVLISFGDPYFISTVPGVQSYLCAYSDSEPVIESAIETLFGRNNPKGRLPVTIPHYGDYGHGLRYP